MMEQHEVRNSLLEFVARELLDDERAEGLGPDDDLLAGQLVDSLGVMRIIAFLEARYGISIPPADVIIENFIDIRAISAYLVSRHG